MTHSKTYRAAVTGLGMAAGALLGSALVPAAASADAGDESNTATVTPDLTQPTVIDIDGHHGPFTDVFTATEPVDIFNNYGPTTTDITFEPGRAARDVADVSDISRRVLPDLFIHNNHGPTTTDAVDNVNNAFYVDIANNYGPTTTDFVDNSDQAGPVVEIDGNHGPTTTDVVDTNGGNDTLTSTVNIANNFGPTTTDLNADGGLTDVLAKGNHGPTTIDLDNSSQGFLALANNFGPTTINVTDGNFNDIAVESGHGPVTINDDGTAPLYVTVDHGVVGPVTADVDGHTAALAALPTGEEYLFVDGTMEIISTI
ncbi:MAG: hypothetical protein ACRDTN_02125, partial [Mycobacterium sp.]